MENSLGHARALSSLSEWDRMMVLSESVEVNNGNGDTLANYWLLTDDPDDKEGLKAFCIGGDGLTPTLSSMYTNFIVLLSCLSFTDVTIMNSLLKSGSMN